MTVTLYLWWVDRLASTHLLVVSVKRLLGSLELPEGDIDGDTTLTLGLQLVEDPCVLEGTLAEFGGFLLWLSAMCSARCFEWQCCLVVMVVRAKPGRPTSLSRICDEGGVLWRGRGMCHRDKMAVCPSDAHLLELLDGTLVNTTALVDQVCDVCESLCSSPMIRGGVYLRPVVVDLPESTWPMTTTLM